ncbi:hypothetical protein [Streptomyces sp. NBC_01217]|uniref:hypothetical protein n=1 Tax=Streptomyces sp. NBC_01217 TaxID=2903779 RepID=UPI002E133019|nr:hypothetical protein OG507_21075 [Streptomyces sp. NBC_01217]
MNHRATLADLDAMAYVIIRPTPAADDTDDFGTYAVQAAAHGMGKRAAAYALRQVADRFDADAARDGDQPLGAAAIAEADARNAQLSAVDRPAGLDALLGHVAANLPAEKKPAPLTPAELAQGQADADALAAEFPDTTEQLLAELADDIPHRRAHAIAADYLARHRTVVLAEQRQGDAAICAEAMLTAAGIVELVATQMRECDGTWPEEWSSRDVRDAVQSAAAAVRDHAATLMAAAPTAPAEEQPAAPAVGARYTKRLNPSQIVTVTRVWEAEDGHTAVAYEWRDDRPGQCGSACPLDVFHREYRPAAEEPPAPALRLPQIAAPCPLCLAPARQLCTSHSGTRQRLDNTHQARTKAYRESEAGR